MGPLTRVFLLTVSCIAVIDTRRVSEKYCTLVQSGEKCRAVFYTECTAEFLQREYPGLYYHGNTTMAAPNLTITTTDKSYGRGPEVKWYSEVDVIIRPDSNSTTKIHGFEVWIQSIEGTRCMVVTLSDNGTLSDINSMRGINVSLKLRMSANITVWQLPKSASSSPARSLIRAGINREIPTENSSLWYSEILFRNKSRDRIVEVQFQSAPENYGIKYYNIQLRRVTQLTTRGASYRTTSHSWMEYVRSPWVYVKFRDVKPGTYDVMVEPYDDLEKSKNNTCRCKKSAKCYPCRSTRSPIFTITETPLYTTDAEIKTSVTMLSLTPSDLQKSVNKLTSSNHTTVIKKQDQISDGAQSAGDITVIETPYKSFNPHSNDGPTLIKTPNRVSNWSRSTDGTNVTKTPNGIFNRPHSADSTSLIKTLNKISNRVRSTDVPSVTKTPYEIITNPVVPLRPSSILNPSLSEVSENNSHMGRNFEADVEDSGGSQLSGKEWEIPVSVLSVLGITVGAVLSIFAVVKFRRRGQFVVSKSSSAIQPRTETSVLIVHDIKHSEDAEGLMSLIIKDLHISVENVLFPNKSSLINNSDFSIFVLWMNPRSFTKFECSFLKDKEIPSVAQTHLQSRFVVVESRNAERPILPRIQYWTKFVLDTELDLFLEFLRNNTKEELQKSWTADQHVSTEIPEKSNAIPVPYNRMDSGIHSEYENETDYPFFEDKSHEEYASIAAVTIGEYQMGVPVGHPNKVTASFPQLNLSNSTVAKNVSISNGRGQIHDISRLNTRESFIPPETTSYYDADGSLFSEAIMLFNERNIKQTGPSEDPLSLIEENVGTHCNSTNRRIETPVCYQNMLGFDDEERESEDEERFMDKDTISVGGQSC
ncbi:uncharacterized protein LOC133199172 [Saccostrea echinata]|uniref:uncharacterized protein LOC133199172 n=1 Tax=Saccostrea echinata TaxID=191078 RepID=UPI002A81680D|nr:uncharacterized protein LOC133199172 [Saccostrea echinata]